MPAEECRSGHGGEANPQAAAKIKLIEGPFKIEYKYNARVCAPGYGLSARALVWVQARLFSCSGSVCLGIVGSELQRSANNVKEHATKILL